MYLDSYRRKEEDIMRKTLAGLGSLLGAVAALIGLAAKYLPVDQIVGSFAWLGFLARLKDIAPYWLVIAAAGAVVAVGLCVLWAMSPSHVRADEHAADPAPTPLGQIYRADNLDIRARVKDLLHRAWGGPFISLVVGAIPIAAVYFVVHAVLRPFQELYARVSEPFAKFFLDLGGFKSGWAMILVGVLPDLSGVPKALMVCVPGFAALIAAALLAFGPMRVSRADYFTRLLYGRKPSPFAVYGCFGNTYVRSLGGMAYHTLWLAIWGLAAASVPPALYLGGMDLINRFPEYTTPRVLTLMPALVIATAASFVILLVCFVNRWLAYSLAPCLLATQKNLPPRGAMRASRWLMRGKKKRLLAMWLSFLYYLLPAICAAVLLPLVGLMAETFSFTEYLTRSLRQFFIVVIVLNQLLLVYAAPVAYASFYAFYLEAKRDFKDNHPTLMYIMGAPRKEKKHRRKRLETNELNELAPVVHAEPVLLETEKTEETNTENNAEPSEESTGT